MGGSDPAAKIETVRMFAIRVTADDRTAYLVRTPELSAPPPSLDEIGRAGAEAGLRVPLVRDLEKQLSARWEALAGDTRGLVIARALPPLLAKPGRWELRDNPPLPVLPGDPVARWNEGQPGRQGVSIRGRALDPPSIDEKTRPCTGRLRLIARNSAAVARIMGLPVLSGRSLDLCPLISISADRSCAKAIIPPRLAGNLPTTEEALLAAFRASGIVVGLDLEAISAAVQQARSSGKAQTGVVIARGHPARPGEVSRYRFHAQEDDVLLPGAVIAERISLGTGRHGEDVTGRELRFDSPSQPQLIAGACVELEEPLGRFVATNLGRLRFTGDQVTLLPLIQIAEDGLSAELEAFPELTEPQPQAPGGFAPHSAPVDVDTLVAAMRHEGIAEDCVQRQELALLVEEARGIERDADRGVRRRVALGRAPQRGESARIRFEFTVSGEAPDPEADQVAPLVGDQLLAAGQPLAIKTPAGAGVDGHDVRLALLPAEPGRDLPLAAGAGVAVSADGLHFSVAGPDPIIPVLAGMKLCARSTAGLAEDLLSAHFPSEECPPQLIIPDRQGLLCALERAGVVFGIDEDAVDTLAARAGESWNPEDPPVILAVGRPPEHGQAALFERHVDLHNRFAGAEGDEQVNFREMIHSRAVGEGHHLASRVPPTDGGEPGLSVVGTELLSVDGGDDTPTAGRGVELSSDGRLYLATQEGIYTEQQKLIEVLENYIIDGDVDYSVGNIDASCMVTIEGKVCSGFEVRAQGPVVIFGSVEDARICSTSDVLIEGGIYFSNRGEVRSEGNIDVGIVYRAPLFARGEVRVRREAINAQIRTLQQLSFGPGNSRAVGGSLWAQGGVVVDVLGSELGVHTEVVVGATVSLNEEDAPEAPESGWASLIPATGSYPATVRVRGTAHPGVVVRILGWSFEVQEPMFGIEFYLDSSWQIQARSYR